MRNGVPAGADNAACVLNASQSLLWDGPAAGSNAERSALYRAGSGLSQASCNTARTIRGRANDYPDAQVFLHQTWARPDMVHAHTNTVTDPNTGVVTLGTGTSTPTDASLVEMRAELHASKDGAYRSALTLLGTLTGLDPASLGAGEIAAHGLGLSAADALALPRVASAPRLTARLAPGSRAAAAGATVGRPTTAHRTMADVFLSYCSDDRPAAQAIAQALTARGRSVWWDRSIRAGEDFFDVIEQQLDRARCVVVLWSPASVASRWVRAEATEALQQGKLIPLLIGDCRPPLVFRQVQALPVDPSGQLDVAAAVEAVDREVAAHLGTLDAFERLPLAPPGPVGGDADPFADVFGEPRVRPAARPEARTPPAAPPHPADALVDAFLQGAGMEVQRDAMGDLSALFRQVGALVKASIEGAGNYLRTQVYFKRELRIEHTVIAPRSNNPLKFVSDYQALAKVLLLQRSEAFMDGPAAIREALQEAQHSYLAHYKAMQASVLAAFDLLQAGQAAPDDRASASWWPWQALRRQRLHRQQQAQHLADLRQAFSDGDGPIQDAYLRAYLDQIASLRAASNPSDGQRQAG